MTRTLLFPGGFSLFVEQEFGARRRGPSSRFCRSPAPVAEATAADETIQQMVGRIRSCPDPGDASTVLYDGAMTAKHHENLLKQGLLLMNRPPAKKRTAGQRTAEDVGDLGRHYHSTRGGPRPGCPGHRLSASDGRIQLQELVTGRPRRSDLQHRAAAGRRRLYEDVPCPALQAAAASVCPGPARRP